MADKTKEELIEEIIKKDALITEIEAKKNLQRLFLFNQNVLSAETGQQTVPLAKFHEELCDFVEEYPQYRKLILLPRGHLKSTLITIGYSLYRIIKNPNIRILIVNATHEMSKTFLNQIKNQLTRNKKLLKYYGDLAKNADKWSDQAITIPLEDGYSKKEPTVTVFGVTSNWVSQHYDLIILDDLVCRENIGTKEQIDKVITAYRDITDLADPGTEIVVIGTTWHDADLYAYIQDKENHLIENFKMYKREAIEGAHFVERKEGGWEIKEGKILWPARFDRKELTLRLNDQQMEHFSAQYLNNPVPERSAFFKKHWMHYYDKADLKGLKLNVFSYVDPAFTESKKADYTAIVTIGVDIHDIVYILEVVREHFDPVSLLNELFYVRERWHPREIFVEAVAAQKTIRPFAEDEMKRKNMYLPLNDIKPDYRDTKEMRIKSLQTFYANGHILHCKEVRNMEYLEDELFRFPRGQHDDCIDALAYFTTTAFPAKRKVSSEGGRRTYLY